jgi:hypothetical protein
VDDHATKRCWKCGEVKPLGQFRRNTSKRDGRRASCQDCERDRDRQRYQANREATLEYQRQRYKGIRDVRRAAHRRWVDGLRDAVFNHYGRICACCGTTENLSVDHINGGGVAHRRALFGRPNVSEGFYVWLIRGNFPSGYQTLCVPCNASKRSGDRCRLDHDLEYDDVENDAW